MIVRPAGFLDVREEDSTAAERIAAGNPACRRPVAISTVRTLRGRVQTFLDGPESFGAGPKISGLSKLLRTAQKVFPAI